MARSDERAKPPPSGGNTDPAIAALEERVTALESGQTALNTRLTTAESAIDALEDRVAALEGAAVEPPPIIEPPIEPPPVITGTLSAAVAFADRTVTFAMSDGVDLGNYTAPTAGFTQGCVRVGNDTLPNFFVDFRLDAEGGRAEVVFWNGECAGDVPSGFTNDLPGYTATIVDADGNTIHTERVPHHYWGSRWRWQSAPRLLVRNAAEVFAEGFLPAMSQKAARIEGYSGIIVPQPPGPQGTYTTFMAAQGDYKLGLVLMVDTGGERNEIGLVTEWQADWLLRDTESSLHTLLQQAEMCAGDWGWFIPDQVTGAPVDYKADDAHYRMHEYQNGYDGYWIKFGNRNGWDIHEADSHIPSIFYLPWALTEDPYLIEAQQYLVQYGTGWTIYQRETVYTAVPGTRVIGSYTGEQRTLGWGIRNLAACWRMTPATAPKWLLPQSYYEALAADYSALFDTLYVKSNKPRHAVFHTISDDPYFQAFEQSYAIMGLALADLVQMPTGSYPSWKQHLDFFFGFMEGITSATSGWNRQCPQPHDVLAEDLDKLPSPSWGSAWAGWQHIFQTGTFPNAASPGNQQGGSMGNCSQITAACAVAKQRGVPAATDALAWMDYFVDYNYPNNSDASMGINFYAKCGFS
jgi:hypothetical protein